MKNKLLALDQSSRITGWAVFEDDKLIASGKFTVTDKNMGQRLIKIRNFIINLVKEYQITEAIFEDIQLQENIGNNVQTFKILAEVFGIVYELFEELKIPNSAVLSLTWKSKLGIEGLEREEQKKNAQAFVLKNYNLDVSQDESDAICIGTYKVKKDFVPIDTKKEDGFNWD